MNPIEKIFSQKGNPGVTEEIRRRYTNIGGIVGLAVAAAIVGFHYFA